jgi:carbohydrate diacid regulator
MVIVAEQFERVAQTVMERTAELLGATVSVADQYGVIIASTTTDLEGQRFIAADTEDEYLRIPLRLESATGEVIISQPDAAEEISPRLARVMAELIVNQATVVERLPNKTELKNKFIHDLLHGSSRDESSLLREAQILGMDLTVPRLVMLIDAGQYIVGQTDRSSERRTQRRAQLVIGSVVDFFMLPNDTICAYIGDGEVAVLKASNTSALSAWADSSAGDDSLSPSWANLTALKRAAAGLLRRLTSDTHSAINLGIGRYHPGIRGLARSYADARAALSLGRRFHGQSHIHCLDELGIASFIGVPDERTKIDLARYLLSPLDHEPVFLQTLEAFFAHDCSPSTTAAALSIHRNTLTYRLDKITSLTGLDPRRFDDAVQIRLSLLLRSLQPTAGIVQVPN